MNAGSIVIETNVVDLVRENRGWFFGLGLTFIVTGFLAIILPQLATLAVEILIGWLLLLGGMLHGANAVQSKRWKGATLPILTSLLYILAGTLLLVFPLGGMLTLTLILSAFFLAEGAIKLALAWQLRSVPGWGWLLLSGLLAIALGFLIVLAWPETAFWMLGLLFGIDLIIVGISLVMVAQASKARSSLATS